MEDLKIAREHLLNRAVTLCIVRNGKILFETASHGLSGFLRATEELGEQLSGASVADKIVGKAVALLCLHSKIEAVYASVISRTAKELFEQHSVCAEWGELVENILSDCKPTACPFERLAAEIADPHEGYKRLKALQDSLRHRR
jgi:hypothetical protein